MKLIVVLFCVIAVVAAAPGRSYYGLAPSGRVVGGVDALPHQFPAIVSLQRVVLNRSSHVCGGSIINPLWILTAAHCITELPAGTRFLIWAGSHNISAEEENTRQIRAVVYSITHPDYQGGVNPSDIAVMRMERPLEYTQYVQESIFPQPGEVFESGPSVLAGWGSTGGVILPRLPDILQTAEKPLLDFDTCERANGAGSPLGPTNICTGPLSGGVAACSGDSGGPLYVVDNNGLQKQIGIVSWGWFPCGTVGRPSVYVGVPSYIEWVYATINTF
ncbi:chymotrypsin-C-like [Toxorhynchites rutilus septentrionalis]|uniref:chymotrypsin-C-like n=1 Tax=Toxorhynchites rutilus septentrionalis TaxID=329112 RepID=UPI002479E545|nr:chymotrypsin-C-like [Toxorhynchites rutilus septentrionalis]